MIVHNNFSESMVALTSKKSFVKRRELREKVEAFIRDEINEDGVVSISESSFQWVVSTQLPFGTESDNIAFIITNTR